MTNDTTLALRRSKDFQNRNCYVGKNNNKQENKKVAILLRIDCWGERSNISIKLIKVYVTINRVRPTCLIQNGWPYYGISRACWAKDVGPTSNHPLEITLGWWINTWLLSIAVSKSVLHNMSSMILESLFSYFRGFLILGKPIFLKMIGKHMRELIFS